MARARKNKAAQSVTLATIEPAEPQKKHVDEIVVTPIVGGVISKRTVRMIVRESFDGATPEEVSAAVASLRQGVYRKFADLCTKMLTDPTVRRAEGIRRAAVSGRERAVAPPASAKDDPLAKHAADVWREKVEEIPDFDTHVGRMMGGTTWGLTVSEINWVYERGWWVPRFEQHDTRECEWIWDGGLGIRDADNTLHKIADYPGKFWTFIPSNVVGQPVDQGDLIAACYYWVFKVMGVKFWLIGSERFGNPLILGFVPRGAPPGARQALMNNMSNLSGDSVAAFDEGNNVQVIDAKAQASSGVWKDLVGEFDKQIQIALCGTPDIIQASEVGSYSSVSARNTVRLETSAIDAKQFWDSFKRDVTYWFFRYNRDKFGGVIPPLPIVETIFETEVDKAAIKDAVTVGVKIKQSEARSALGLEALGTAEDDEFVTMPVAAPSYGGGFSSTPTASPGGADAEAPLASVGAAEYSTPAKSTLQPPTAPSIPMSRSLQTYERLMTPLESVLVSSSGAPSTSPTRRR